MSALHLVVVETFQMGLEEGAWRADLRWALAMLASVVQSLVVNELKLLSGGMSVGLTPFSSLWASDSQWG